MDRVPVTVDPAHAVVDEVGAESIGQGVDRHAVRGVDAEVAVVARALIVPIGHDYRPELILRLSGL